MAMKRTSTREGHNLPPKRTIGKSGNHPVLSAKSGPRYNSLGFASETDALENGVVDSGGPRAMEYERNTKRSNLGLTHKAGYHHVQTVQNQNKYGNVVTKGEPEEERARRLEREASLNRVQVQPRSRRRKTWYKPWTWLNGGNKLNKKKIKSFKNKNHKHKTRKYKTRKNKTRKQKRK